MVHLNPTIDTTRTEQVVTMVTERLTSLTRTLCSWMLDQPHSLAELEHHVLGLLKQLGASLLAEVCSLANAQPPRRTLQCPCGQPARYQRERKAQVTSLFCPISISHSYTVHTVVLTV